MMKIFNLYEEIFNLSQNKDNFEEAKKERKLVRNYHDDDGDSCICGKQNIKDIFCFENIYNGNIVILGSECYKKLHPTEIREVINKTLGKLLKNPKKILKRVGMKKFF